MANIITSNIPNALTCCNLISGCVATAYAFGGQPKMALLFIITGAVFDFFDGMSARLLKVSSPIGKELDSLADDVTFGVAPATIVFYQLSVMDYPFFIEPLRSVLPFFAYIMAAFSALRLAKFNIDVRQATSFIGMPTPANALFWGSLVVGGSRFLESSPSMTLLVLALVLLCSWLMVAEIPMFALKFKHWGWSGNEVKYSFVVFSALVLLTCGWLSFAIIITCYVIVSIVMDMRSRKSNAGKEA